MILSSPCTKETLNLVFGATFCCYNQTPMTARLKPDLFWLAVLEAGKFKVEKLHYGDSLLLQLLVKKTTSLYIYIYAKQERWTCFIITHNHHTWSGPMKGIKPSWCSNNLFKVTNTMVSIFHAEFCRETNCIQILVASMSQLNDNATYINRRHLCTSRKQCFK